MSGVFSRGLLKLGHPLYPVRREDNLGDIARQPPDPELVLIAVGESDIHNMISNIPSAWSDKTVLLQNELLPSDWEGSDLKNPTVISVWFEKKRGQDYKVIVPSPIFGPKARLIQEALATLDIPNWIVANSEELLFELVRKNLYILTSNICGLALPEGATVGDLIHNHQVLFQSVSAEILEIQYSIIGKIIDRNSLIEATKSAFEGDLDHKCMGRSATARLKRAMEMAQKLKIATPTLRNIADSH